MAEIKELLKEFTGKGETRDLQFTQIFENGSWYVYQVDYEGQTWYEVFKRKVNSYYKTVTYPSSKAFGVWAWSSKSYKRAINRVPKDDLVEFAPTTGI